MIREKKTRDGLRFCVYLKNKGFPRYVGIFDSRREAERAEEEERVRRRRVDRGEVPGELDPKRTFDASMESWLAALEKRKSRSHKGYSKRVELYLTPRFKGCVLAAVTKPRIMEMQEQLATKYAPSTVNGIVTCLSAAFRYFVDRGWAETNPCRGLRALEEPRDAYNWLRTKEEITKLLTASRDELRDLVAVAVLTGMRLDETLHLHWADVDIDRRLVTVQRGRQGTVKSGKIRHVPILDALLPALRRRRLHRGGATLVFPGKSRQGMKEGATGPTPRAKQGVGLAYKRALKRAGLDKTLRWHDLRHTFASHWMIDGGDIFKLSRILGHSDVRMTMRYAHLAPDAFEQDYGRLGLTVPTEAAKIVEIVRDERGHYRGTRTLAFGG